MDQTIKDTGVKSSSADLGSIIYGGLTAGVLDGTAACVVNWLSPERIFHYVASGLIGKDASYNGGLPTVFLGILIHFCIAMASAVCFYVLSRLLPSALKYFYIAGPLWGIFWCLFMALVIVPLTFVPSYNNSIGNLAVGALIQVFCVGSPIALWAWALRYKA